MPSAVVPGGEDACPVVEVDRSERWPGEVLGGVSEPTAPGLAVKLITRSAPALSAVLDAARVEIRAVLWNVNTPTLRRY
jgi:hypothetical protein